MRASTLSSLFLLYLCINFNQFITAEVQSLDTHQSSSFISFSNAATRLLNALGYSQGSSRQLRNSRKRKESGKRRNSEVTTPAATPVTTTSDSAIGHQRPDAMPQDNSPSMMQQNPAAMLQNPAINGLNQLTAQEPSSVQNQAITANPEISGLQPSSGAPGLNLGAIPPNQMDAATSKIPQSTGQVPSNPSSGGANPATTINPSTSTRIPSVNNTTSAIGPQGLLGGKPTTSKGKDSADSATYRISGSVMLSTLGVTSPMPLLASPIVNESTKLPKVKLPWGLPAQLWMSNAGKSIIPKKYRPIIAAMEDLILADIAPNGLIKQENSKDQTNSADSKKQLLRAANSPSQNSPGQISSSQPNQGPGQGQPLQTNQGQPQAQAGAMAPGQPQVGAVAPGQPQVGATAAGQPQVGATAPGQPQAGATAPGQPQVGATAPGQPQVGAMAPGQPQVGATAPGQPQVGATAPGQPQVGATAPTPLIQNNQPQAAQGQASPILASQGRPSPQNPRI